MAKKKFTLKRGTPEIATIGKVSSRSTLKATGQGWAYWCGLLEEQGALHWTHQEIVKYLRDECQLTPWWQQWVAQGFKIYHGQRIEGQTLSGEYTLTVTKLLAVSQKAAWKFLLSPQGMALWLKPLSSVELKEKVQFETLDGYYGEVRSIQKLLKIRLHWIDPETEHKTYVVVGLVPRPGNKSILFVSHEKLKTARQKSRLRTEWRHKLDLIADEARAESAPRGSAIS